MSYLLIKVQYRFAIYLFFHRSFKDGHKQEATGSISDFEETTASCLSASQNGCICQISFLRGKPCVGVVPGSHAGVGRPRGGVVAGPCAGVGTLCRA